MNTTPGHQYDTTSANNPDPAAVDSQPSTDQWLSREWTDDDYQLFVHRCIQGELPEVCHDPTAWDDYFVLSEDHDAPYRPTVISSADFHAHMPSLHRDGFGLLSLKLWAVARAKGYTRALEEQQEQARQQRQRDEINALKENLPAPEPSSPIDPRQQWYAAIMANTQYGSNLTDKVKLVQSAVLEGQPHRYALLQQPDGAPPEPCYGPVMFPDTPDALADPFEPEEPQTVPTRWTPGAPTRQIINGAARDIADLVSLLIARQKMAVGFKADHSTIVEVRHLTRSLRELNQIVKETDPRKRGPKPRTVKDPDC